MSTAVAVTGWSTAELVEAARRGEPFAWEVMVERYGPLVRGVVRRRRLQECDVADAVQSTWLRAMERLGTLDRPERLPGWLATVASREALAVIRRSGRELVAGDDLPESASGDADPETAAVRGEVCGAVTRCVAGLGARRERLVWELFAGPDRDYARVARVTGMPTGSIGPTRGRLLRRLRTALEEAGFGD